MTSDSLRDTNLSPLASLEALLFVASAPVTPAQLAAAMDLQASDVEKLLDSLEAQYKRQEAERPLQARRAKVPFFPEWQKPRNSQLCREKKNISPGLHQDLRPKFCRLTSSITNNVEVV